jgi:hypothetical protein
MSEMQVPVEDVLVYDGTKSMTRVVIDLEPLYEVEVWVREDLTSHHGGTSLH